MNYYGQISEGYEELHKEEQLKKICFIKENIKRLDFKIKKSDLLLDVGCGTGLTTEPWNCKKIGLDPAKKLLEKARNPKEIEYVHAPAEKIPFDDNKFDIVTSITAIQNFKDIKKGLQEINRVGKSRFILTFLKKSAKKEFIEKEIQKLFKIVKKVEEDKDIVYFLEKKLTAK